MHYFVTGATGFIGKRMVRALLSEPGSTVWFLVREDSRAKLPALYAWWHATPERAIALTGDLLAPDLGIAASDIDALTQHIDHVFHFAAIYDMAASAEALHAANVDGTRRAVAFAQRIGAGCFHHVSSIAAAGLYEGVFREDMFEEAEGLAHPYFATKHEAERIVRNECSVPWRIYRPGMVGGDSVTGEADKADGPYYFFKPIQRLRSLLPPWMPAPGIEGGRINIVPVDYVVAAMRWIAHLPGLDGRCFHLTDPAPHRVGEALNIFARAAHAPRLSLRINAALFGFIPQGILRALGTLAPVRRLREALMRDLALPEGILQFINYPTRFDNREAAAALADSGIACPPLERYAAAIWDYWERHLDPELFIDRSLRGEVAGKVVLVTGGSSGIGLATALRVAEAGALTLICGRDRDKLAAAQSTAAARGLALHAHAANLADMADCDRLLAEVLAEHGRIDILINNAGRSIRRTVEASYDRFHDLERTMQLNYFGAMRLALGILPQMAQRRAGQIINISTIGALTYAPRFSAYVASKAALDAWTLCAAAEYADVGVKFSIVNMPLVRTPMIAPTRVYEHVPALTPEEAAELVVEAIIRKPVRVATRIGLTGAALQTMAPGVAQILLNSAFRLFPDTEPGAPPIPAHEVTPELLAMQQLFRGVHL
ncbi:SDR family oxidoreductase [Noviherbaspirillum pedocola]|uniref:SDR family oxidoreductase n=1 Tax=Noviherbaspirillum pedocola TaxID=2801341 RepID=A0A934SXM5_9BURK|nr:SDR family oxidoreductase [Noviherbaspirillum pedocola]MBK4737632.1 SDR family oxidoreductase [Noviherbaspirillum pedocola]